MEFTKLLDTLNVADTVTISGVLWTLFGILFCICLHSVKSWKSKKPPGPVGLPFVGYVPFLGNEPHKTLWNMKRKYGDIMGVHLGSQYVVFLSEYNLAKEVLTHPAAQDRAPHLFKYLPHIGFGGISGDPWIEQRKFCRVATRDVEFGEVFWENLIMEEVSSFVNEIRVKKGEAFDICDMLSASIISNILSILIGRRLNKEAEADKIKQIVEYADVVLTATGVSKAVTAIPGFRKFCEIFRIGDYRTTSQRIQGFMNFIKEEVHRHKTSTSINEIDDFINIYLNKLAELKKFGNKKHYFSEEMLEGNVNLLFLGGTDTIISSLLWALRLMAKHKDIQERVYAELMEVTGHEGRARYRERQNIPYTFAVLMETQRVGSILALSSNRGITRDIHIRGFTIPKGSNVSANLWGLHHDPTYWENPEDFRPERFLTDNGAKLITQPPSYLPFSIGQRNCPGEIIAWMEILFYFAEVVKNFEISTSPGDTPNFTSVFGLVSRLVNQQLCFKERTRNP